ncbi:MAG: response regulator transcription factor, partial [Candidatus Binatia bacterium]
ETNFHRTLERILCRCGYEVCVVNTGEAALERAFAEPFDAVVSQVDLPGSVCGLTLLQRLRERGIHVPVMMLTEQQTNRLRNVLGCTNGATCLNKDVDLDLLKSKLAEFLSTAKGGSGLQ